MYTEDQKKQTIQILVTVDKSLHLGIQSQIDLNLERNFEKNIRI